MQHVRHVGLERAVRRCALDALAYQVDALAGLLQAQVRTFIGIAGAAADDVEVELVVHQVGFILAQVAPDTAAARIRADDAVGVDHVRAE